MLEVEIIEKKETLDLVINNNKETLQTELNATPTFNTTNYNFLQNKPQINGIELIGNKTLEELGIKQEYTANDITFEDGSTFQEKYDSGELKGEQGLKGDKGEQGIQGIAGKDGTNGTNGKDGYTPIKGVDYFDGKDGSDGKDGYTPIKGTDYYTEADKQEMVQLVLAVLPSSEGVSY